MEIKEKECRLQRKEDDYRKRMEIMEKEWRSQRNN